MSYQVLARKWRPRTFQTMVGQEPILRMLTNALDTERLHHAYLFSGTRGVGKTTLGRIFAKCLNCEKGITSTPCETCNNCQAINAGRFIDLIEVDAASRTKVEDTRELLDNIHYQPAEGRFKIYLIDEVHMLSQHSFNALLKTLEEPPSYVKFLLATTDPKRLPITVLSRCLQFHLKKVPIPAIAAHLQFICTSENKAYETPALQLLAKAADGSLRDALSLLDQTLSYCGATITLEDTRQLLGSIEPEALLHLLHALAAHDGKALLAEIATFSELAPDFNQALEDLLTLLHQISVRQVIPSTLDPDHIQQLATQFSPEDIQLYYQIALMGRRDLPYSPSPEQAFEMTLLRMLAFTPLTQLTQPIIQSISPSQPVMAIQKTAEAKLPASLNWSEIVPLLKLTGLAQALAVNCSLTAITEKTIELTLSNQHKPMLNTKLIDRIEQGLSEYYNKPLKLSISLTENPLQTPAKQQQAVQASRQAVATETIKNDAQVQAIVDIFDATLDINSIKALDPQ